MKFILFFYLFLVGLFSISCGTNKRLTQEMIYFRGLDESKTEAVQSFEPKIEKADILFISVSTTDIKTDQLINAPNYYQTNTQSAAGGTTTLGYLVNNE